jgi:hypothetical protein
MARADSARAGLTIRCAIYTRKSSDEGLEQEFNSLDAQREACEAYIVSQRRAGWVALADMYDDGGLSGGTMERPALKRLLEDIKASKVQTVVVYKVDRLTRSLADFAKIVDVLDAHNASFVSVTQQFNTTTSMGPQGHARRHLDPHLGTTDLGRTRHQHASTDVMPARNAVDRLAVGKCLSNQGSLLVLAPAPSRLTQNNLHMASARDQSKRPVDRLGAAKILTYKPHHARRPSA